MVRSGILTVIAIGCQAAHAACPHMENEARSVPASNSVLRRDEAFLLSPTATDEFLAQFEVEDKDAYLTNTFGGPIEDQESLSAGERGPTLLEDFTFREKIMHFGKVIARSIRIDAHMCTQIMSEFQKERYMLEVLVHMECSRRMAIGQTSQGPRS